MEYGSFNLATTVAILFAWVDVKQHRPLFEKIGELTPLLPQLDALYAQLGQIRSAESSLPPDRQQLAKQLRYLDGLHHRKMRGLYNILSDLVTLTDDDALAIELTHIRDTLFPEGSAGLGHRQSVRSTPGSAATQITPRMRELLMTTRYNDRTLWDEFEAWLETDLALGALEDARGTDVDSALGISAADIRNARQRWIRLVSAVVGIMDVVPSLGQEVKGQLLTPLKQAEIQYIRRSTDPGAPMNDDLNVAAAMADIASPPRETSNWMY